MEYTTGEHYQSRSKVIISSIYSFLKKQYKKHKDNTQKVAGQKFYHSTKLITQESSPIYLHHKSLRKNEHKKDIS